MTHAEYQKGAFGRPSLYLGSLLNRGRYTGTRGPPEGCWSAVGNQITVSVAPVEFARTH